MSLLTKLGLGKLATRSGSAISLKPHEFLESKFPDFSTDIGYLEGKFEKESSVGRIEYGFFYSSNQPHIGLSSEFHEPPLLANAYRPVYLQDIDELESNIALLFNGTSGEKIDSHHLEDYFNFSRAILLREPLTHENLKSFIKYLAENSADMEIRLVQFENIPRNIYKNLGIPPEKLLRKQTGVGSDDW